MKKFSTIAVAFFPDETHPTHKLLADAMTIARWMSAELHVLAGVSDQAELNALLHAGDGLAQSPVRVCLHIFEGGYVEGLFTELEKSGAQLLVVKHDSELTSLKTAVLEACPIPIILDT